MTKLLRPIWKPREGKIMALTEDQVKDLDEYFNKRDKAAADKAAADKAAAEKAAADKAAADAAEAAKKPKSFLDGIFGGR
jgi:membrane protein involved in colicin uptake